MDAFGNTELHVAENGLRECVGNLIDKGTDFELINVDK